MAEHVFEYDVDLHDWYCVCGRWEYDYVTTRGPEEECPGEESDDEPSTTLEDERSGDVELERLALLIRVEAERLHGCRIGFEPREPCSCVFGRLADQAWQLALRTHFVSISGGGGGSGGVCTGFNDCPIHACPGPHKRRGST